MYHFTDDLNLNQHFWFDKKLIENMNWAMLPKASKSVFPVIACHRNKRGLSFPGEQTISALSGRTEKIVREGIRGLAGFPNFKMNYYTTKHGRRSKRFFLKTPPFEKGRSFPFHKIIILGGNWSMLKPSATAIYPVMRYFGYFDEPDEDVEFDDETFSGRTHDFCQAQTSLLAKYAGIARRSVFIAMDNLQEHYLIERSDRGNELEWKVFFATAETL